MKANVMRAYFYMFLAHFNNRILLKNSSLSVISVPDGKRLITFSIGKTQIGQFLLNS